MISKNVVILAAVVLCCVYESKGVIDGPEINNVDEDNKNITSSDRTGRSGPLHKECSSLLSSKCLKIHMLSFIEHLSSRDELPLIPGLSIVKENQTASLSPEEMAAELSRQFPGKPEEKLNRFLLYRLQDYLDGHSLRYRLLDPQTTKEAMEMAKGDKESVGRKAGGGGGGGGLGGGKGGGGALLAAALMMKGTLAAAALGALALLAGKALMTALMSLLLSALVGLKGHGGHKSTTYEIITKPEVSHHHSHSHEEHHEHEHGHHGGYRRAYDLGYNSYMPYETTTS
ncbi:uncharacterized protein LOC115454362 [Manduca sexta]|uniref:Osiris 16 n=1 Tax=Manduca sexta TaxID=7130 RepID=A0A922CZX3_MANSE|nr:uncharacterized protein LOC115452903 [Manduca sexta]XP_030038959.1 uncharacterized protein LOC115454362 [Manduca sexta]KAG6464211.1 hypothetical protein O3G_MSEX014358 [Manduca sexta]